jgi:hypothetical protein
MPLQLLILSAPTGGSLILDATPFVQACSISRNEHGPQELQATLYRSLYDAFRIYDAPGTLHVELNDGAQCLWAGRLEEPGLNVGGGDRLELHAYGYWRALSDLPYTALWSSVSLDQWKPTEEAVIAGHRTDRYQFEQDGGALKVMPKKNEQFGTSIPLFGGSFLFRPPSGSTRQIIAVQFSYELLAPASWLAALERRNSGLGFVSNAWTLAATGAVQTGAQVLTFSGCDALTMTLYLNVAGPTTFAGETGSAYLKITNLRVFTTTTNRSATGISAIGATPGTATVTPVSMANIVAGASIYMSSGTGGEIVTVTSVTSTTFTATFVQAHGTGDTIVAHAVYADEIIKDLISVTNATNSSQVSSSTINVASPTLDITDAVYEDRVPQDIATELATKGDGSRRVWEVGVDVLRRLFFRVRASRAQTWYVDIADLTLTRSLDGLYNSAYAKYEDASGRTLRSSTSSNAASIQRYGLTRRQAVDTQTTNSTVAASTLSTALAASALIQPRATFTLRAVFAASGARYPVSYVQAGDYLTIRNLPPAASVAADTLRTFRITRVEFDPFTSAIQVEPEAPNPTLAALVGGQR